MPPHPKLLDAVNKGLLNIPALSLSKGEIKELKLENNTLKSEKYLSGTIHAVMLLVDFPDNQHQVEESFFEDLANSIGLNWSSKYPGNTNSGSIREYYLWASKGKMNLIIDVYGWFTAPNNYSYYVNNYYGLGSYPQNAQKLVEDIVEIADNSIDFSKYDNDKDGYIDLLLVVHAGPGAEFTGKTTDIWSHRSAISGLMVDGVHARDYTMEPEYWIEPGDMTIGVYCHEIGHILGLPDLYDTDSYGLGNWSLMSYGCWNGENGMGGSPSGLDAWSKLQTGWYSVHAFSENKKDLLLKNVMNGGDIVALIRNGTDPKEYFLLENRQLKDFDFYLPGKGLLIYHVDENKFTNSQQWYPGLNPDFHYMVALEQADGNFDLEKKINPGDSSDPFPGDTYKTGFTPFTLPSSDYYLNYSGIFVENISKFNDDIYLDIVFNHYPLQPFSPIPEDSVTNVSTNITLKWNCSDPDNDALKYKIYFGTDYKNLQLIESDYELKSYPLNNLNYDTQYYWKIVADDQKGGITEGPVWSFKTMPTPLTNDLHIIALNVPDYLLFGESNVLEFQIISDQDFIFHIDCDATFTYEFDTVEKILFIHLEPSNKTITLEITVEDSLGNFESYYKSFGIFSLISQRSLINNKKLLTIIEYGFDEPPASAFIKQREGVYYTFVQQDIILFEEYLFDFDNGTIESISERGAVP
ncbi:MAG: immune inhibitor [Thermotogaceae bacterium]|nr:immune inhibitor [Thermotogaceae bacterium]